MNPRESRGTVIAAMCRLNRTPEGVWLVPSQSSTEIYKVNLEKKSCTCPDRAEAGHTCKHYFAASIVHRRDYLPDGTMIDTKSITLVKKTTYKQDWHAYNLAQSVEKHRFQELLADLLRGIPELPTKHTGRKPHSTRDSLFAMTYKVYGMFSSRRASCDFRDVHDAGYTLREVPGMKVNTFFQNPAFTPILKQLIAYSARPLRAVETDFAIDSSGFGTEKFETWYDHKYGITRQRTVWVKVHIACGVKTNIVTAVRILDKDAADCPQFVPLVKETKRHFEIAEVSADKAYVSMENFEEVAAMGGQAFIAFKESNTGACGGMFEKAFNYFKFKQDEYMKHYHKRSNVESTFSAIKRKFGPNVRSRNDTAMVNESLCKILCHNLTCLVQEQYTLGIDPIFWEDSKDQPDAGEPTILRLKRNETA